MTSGDGFPDQTHSVTLFIERVKAEDPEAAGQIWQRYFERLLPLARSKLKALSHRAVDEEDILVSVFDRFFNAAKQNRFAKLQDRDDLWQILLVLTERKVADTYRRSLAQKRSGGSADQNEARQAGAGVSDMADPEPSPEFVVLFNDNLARALHRLGETSTREVAILRMEGCQNREIAQQLEISLSSVERKLRVIREVWRTEFAM